MKKLLLILAVTMAFAFASNVSADQRVETGQGLCHFAYDSADSDNEVYFANCANTIETYDDGNGRLAYGQSEVRHAYKINNGTIPHTLNYVFNTELKGSAADESVAGEVLNAPCTMVTSNYDASADANNETVYTTNDWTLVIDPYITDAINGHIEFTFSLSCRGGVAQ